MNATFRLVFQTATNLGSSLLKDPVGTVIRLLKGIASVFFGLFPAMRHKNFVLFFIGQLISFAGTYLQMANEGWQMQGMTHSALQASIVNGCSLAPCIFFSPVGGAIVDRYDPKKVLYWTQILALAQAGLLGALTWTKKIEVWHLYALATSLGFINAVDIPARHSLIIKVVPKKDLTSAIALNGSLILIGLLAGGGMAALFISCWGVASAYFANALTFLAVIFTVWLMKMNPFVPPDKKGVWKEFKLGWQYFRNDKEIFVFSLLVGVIAAFGFSSRGIMPTMTEEKFRAGPDVLGALYASMGGGALIGTILVSSFSRKIMEKGATFRRFVIGGTLLSGLMMFAFAWSQNLRFCETSIFISSLGFVIGFSPLRTRAQGKIGQEMRGRVVGFLLAFFLGGMSLGGVIAGAIARISKNTDDSLQFSGIAMFSIGIALIAMIRKMDIFKPDPALAKAE